jgi:hypothetical protein
MDGEGLNIAGDESSLSGGLEPKRRHSVGISALWAMGRCVDAIDHAMDVSC